MGILPAQVANLVTVEERGKSPSCRRAPMPVQTPARSTKTELPNLDNFEAQTVLVPKEQEAQANVRMSQRVYYDLIT
jgi:hypothetical protein